MFLGFTRETPSLFSHPCHQNSQPLNKEKGSALNDNPRPSGAEKSTHLASLVFSEPASPRVLHFVYWWGHRITIGYKHRCTTSLAKSGPSWDQQCKWKQLRLSSRVDKLLFRRLAPQGGSDHHIPIIWGKWLGCGQWDGHCSKRSSSFTSYSGWEPKLLNRCQNS